MASGQSPVTGRFGHASAMLRASTGTARVVGVGAVAVPTPDSPPLSWIIGVDVTPSVSPVRTPGMWPGRVR